MANQVAPSSKHLLSSKELGESFHIGQSAGGGGEQKRF